MKMDWHAFATAGSEEAATLAGCAIALVGAFSYGSPILIERYIGTLLRMGRIPDARSFLTAYPEMARVPLGATVRLHGRLLPADTRPPPSEWTSASSASWRA